MCVSRVWGLEGPARNDGSRFALDRTLVGGGGAQVTMGLGCGVRFWRWASAVDRLAGRRRGWKGRWRITGRDGAKTVLAVCITLSGMCADRSEEAETRRKCTVGGCCESRGPGTKRGGRTQGRLRDGRLARRSRARERGRMGQVSTARADAVTLASRESRIWREIVIERCRATKMPAASRLPPMPLRQRARPSDGLQAPFSGRGPPSPIPTREFVWRTAPAHNNVIRPNTNPSCRPFPTLPSIRPI